MNNPGFSATPPPPAPPAKRGPSCWVLGGSGCLIIIVIVFALIGYTLYSQRGLIKKSMVANANVIVTEQDLRDIRGAIIRYNTANGTYPATLKQLVPTYLVNASELHSALDDNPDPNHVSFTYAKPPQGAPSTTPIVDISYVLPSSIPNASPQAQVSQPQNFLSISLGGQITQAMYMNGKSIMRFNIPTPPGQP